MKNHEIAKLLDEVADMLEVSEDNFFRVRAYRNAARTVRDHPVALATLPPAELGKLAGIGTDLTAKITSIIQTGSLPMHQELMRKITPGLLELMRIPALGPKRVRQLHEQLNIGDLAQLRRAAESGALRTLRGFGPRMEEKIREAIAALEKTPSRRMLYVEAAEIASNLLAYMKACPELQSIEPAGSFRRRRETVGDLDLLAVSDRASAVIEQFVHFPGIKEVLGRGETKAAVVLASGLQVDLRAIPRESHGAALVYFTGSQAHCVHLRRLAQQRGMLLNEYGLFEGPKVVAGADETEIYRALGLSFIPPELREDRGEIEAAAEGRLPHLINRADLRGDLHSHSTYTDGRASIEEMARRASELGLAYLAVTDHSRRLAMAHGLDPKRLRQQWKEIEKVEARLRGIRLLRGIEVDILEDGTLDLPDDVLSELDWVVASVHYKLDQKPEQMTARLIKAIRNPNVDVIGHPSGRLLARREPSNFDLDDICRVAREEGCALEINSQVDRLDLNDGAALAAKHAGVKMVISSDAHHPRDFDMVEYGVNQARRAWIEPADILNTRPLNQLHQR